MNRAELRGARTAKIERMQEYLVQPQGDVSRWCPGLPGTVATETPGSAAVAFT